MQNIWIKQLEEISKKRNILIESIIYNRDGSIKVILSIKPDK